MKHSPWWELLKPRHWLFVPLFLLLRFVVVLPHPIRMRIGKTLGNLIQLIDKKGKNTTIINLKLCYPSLSSVKRQTLLKESYQSIGMSVIETAIAWFASNAQLPKVEIIGLEHIKKLQAEKKGALIVSAHLSTLEIAGRLFNPIINITAVYRPQKIKLLDYFARYYRAQCYPKIIAREQLRELIRSLQQGEFVWYTPDIDAGLKNSVFVPFFNIPAATITTCSRLTTLGKAACLTIFFYRKPLGKGYQIIISPPLSDFPSGDDTADAARINTLIEEAINKAPDQYLWQYKRFKTRPPGEPRLYSKSSSR